MSQLRRANALVATWVGGEFVIENYISGHETTVSAAMADFIGRFSTPSPSSEVVRSFDRVPDGNSILARLIAQKILLEVGSDLEILDAATGEWKWGHDARLFHFSTRRTRFMSMSDERAALALMAKDDPPPPPYTESISTEMISLLDAVKSPIDFWQVLSDRRTHRSFTPDALSAECLATLLRLTWGATGEGNDPVLGRFVKKTSPSGGARHPVEVYPIIQRVSGIASGVYRFNVQHGALDWLSPMPQQADVVAMCADQTWVEKAAVVCFMVGEIKRSMWKYRSSHAYRVLLLDAGHLGQTFHLVSTALGIAPFTSAALDSIAVEDHLGLDPATQLPLYVAAAGRPAPDFPSTQTDIM